MADVNMAPTRLLGFAGLADIDGLCAAMAAVPGPTLRAVCGWMLSRDQGAVLAPLSSSTTGS